MKNRERFIWALLLATSFSLGVTRASGPDHSREAMLQLLQEKGLLTSSGAPPSAATLASVLVSGNATSGTNVLFGSDQARWGTTAKFRALGPLVASGAYYGWQGNASTEAGSLAAILKFDTDRISLKTGDDSLYYDLHVNKLFTQSNGVTSGTTILMSASYGLTVASDGGIAFKDNTNVNSGSRDVELLRGAANLLSLTDGSTGGSGILMVEHADFAAPAENKVVFYSRDNGSGKTQLVARFPTGAVQVIATEP